MPCRGGGGCKVHPIKMQHLEDALQSNLIEILDTPSQCPANATFPDAAAAAASETATILQQSKTNNVTRALQLSGLSTRNSPLNHSNFHRNEWFSKNAVTTVSSSNSKLIIVQSPSNQK